MRQHTPLLAIAGTILLLACCTQAFSTAHSGPRHPGRTWDQEEEDEDEEGAEEENVAIGELPAAVAQTARAYFADLSKCSASREEEHERMQYEIEGVDAKGHKLSLKLAAEGGVLEVERMLESSALSAAARKTLAARYPGASTASVEGVELHYYEIHMKQKGKSFEVKIAADGSIVGAPNGEDDEHGRGEEEEDEDDDD